MGDKSNYHSLSVGYNKFFIDKRYINLKPCGDGSYGFVASAYDVITGKRMSNVLDNCYYPGRPFRARYLINAKRLQNSK